MKKLFVFILPVQPPFCNAGPGLVRRRLSKIGRIYPGLYITNNGDTIEGYFKHGDQVDNQKRCSYYQNETDKKPTQVFKPEDIKRIQSGRQNVPLYPFQSGGLTAKPLRFNLVNWPKVP